MEIILLDKIDNLGNVGDVITVKPGYARNYLFPKGLAVRSSKRNIAYVEEKRKNIELKIAKEEQASQAILDSLKNVEILMEVEVGENDKLFGSVTIMDLQKALNEQNIEIQKQDILLESSIKSLGAYDIPIKVTSSLKQNIKVNVVKK
ncbi:MAG: 50S ribosomal protein L9 [bacterium TMED144]|nr:MAG: 50S ribosomal protein L9 [bacterium TMED144]|tara:strand:+ start:1486 stop:1929 length:444 start_codon:yes stop_codon:yes gene_type:complete